MNLYRCRAWWRRWRIRRGYANSQRAHRRDYPVAGELILQAEQDVCPWLTRTAGGEWVKRETAIERAFRRMAAGFIQVGQSMERFSQGLRAFVDAAGKLALAWASPDNRNIH